MRHGTRRMTVRATLLVGAAAVLAGCTAAPESDPVVVTPSPSATPTAPVTSIPPAIAPTGTPETLAEGLAVPWSILRLPDGGVLVSERNSGRIVEVRDDGSLREAVTVPGVAAGGEGGLLGLAHLPGDGDRPSKIGRAHV